MYTCTYSCMSSLAYWYTYVPAYTFLQHNTLPLRWHHLHCDDDKLCTSMVRIIESLFWVTVVAASKYSSLSEPVDCHIWSLFNGLPGWNDPASTLGLDGCGCQARLRLSNSTVSWTLAAYRLSIYMYVYIKLYACLHYMYHTFVCITQYFNIQNTGWILTRHVNTIEKKK